MKSEPLVSIITPCYNGEKWIGRLMESVLEQTYSKIEFIVINDGSSDNSEEVIQSFAERLAKKGIIFKYIKQVNKGLGGAINTGLKNITGGFFCWPDADDYLEPTSIEVRVNYLIAHPDVAIVTSNAYIRKWDSINEFQYLVKKGDKDVYLKDQFHILLSGRGVFCPGCHMVRTDCFKAVNPSMTIFPARRGQNWQLLLPLYYKYDRVFLDVPLYNYIDRVNSMSKDKNCLEDVIRRIEEHEMIIMETLKMIEKNQNADLSSEKEMIFRKYLDERMMSAMDFDNKELFREQYTVKKMKYGVTRKERLVYLRMTNPLIHILYKTFCKVRAKDWIW